MEPISIIIPTYKSPDALDLALKSLFLSQSNPNNQVIVVVDGTYEENKEVIEKYKDKIDLLVLEQNVGTSRAYNLGVYNAINDKILIVNDDNVFGMSFDIQLFREFGSNFTNKVIIPNQIEPFPSIFPQFKIKDLGRDPKTFDLNQFWKHDVAYQENKTDTTGYTFPIFMRKIDFMMVGGFDESYPSQGGYVADCDFFWKCQLANYEMIRIYNVHFYHFVSLSVKSPEQIEKSRQEEINCHEYFKYKWGNYMSRNKDNSIFVPKY